MSAAVTVHHPFGPQSYRHQSVTYMIAHSNNKDTKREDVFRSGSVSWFVQKTTFI
ncbi:hypothetical protein MTR_5g054990 [Medicago truncatula]|uniref:Uncharacterized protein n=1 Tax=Medicago truncatula TaxID=3880 RepID=G7JZD4_MEDTR|nr:hypothetical protein MTR_5g054990 [Medicago truncatula]